jgi:hypothetical protein
MGADDFIKAWSYQELNLLFLAHIKELISQAYDTFSELWPEADVNMMLFVVASRV